MTELLRDTYRYRELIWALALRELKVRYKRSVLGFMWALLNPALLMLVLTVVFTTIMPINIPHYAVFLLCTLLPFTFFSQSLSYAVESMVGNADLVKKVAVPKLVFPVAALVSNVINLLLSLIPLVLLVIALRHPLHWTWIFIPIPIAALCILTLGVTFFFATANVYYRDVAHIVQILLQVLFYVTPILYKVDFFPPKYRWLFWLNPLTFSLSDIRMFIYYGGFPSIQSVVASFAAGFLALAIGFTLFRKHQHEFVFYM
ncbi:MAG: ABC transporter permease [Acidobacteriaceae bacterium]|nr:ABC transporter permease [Acidobacteriaceae bacterium]